MKAKEKITVKSIFKRIIKEIIECIPSLIYALVIVSIVNTFTGMTNVEGASMEPTLKTGNRLILNKVDKMLDKVERGDVIVFDAIPDRNIFNKVYFVKRVIAVGGDFLEIKDGKVKVNGVEIDETYANLEGFDDEIKTTIPEDCYYVMGDNRSHSTDSRYFGPIKKSQIVGTIAFQLTPKIEKDKFENEQLKNIESNTN